MLSHLDQKLLNFPLRAASVVFLAALLGFSGTTASSQSTTSDPVKQKLQDDKDKADLQKAIADDQKAIAEDEAAKVKAQYSISTDKLPQGNATLGDKVNIEATILAYRAAQSASPRIVEILTKKSIDPPSAGSANSGETGSAQPDCPSSLIFYDIKQMNDVWAVNVLKEQLKLVQKQGADLVQGPDAAGLFPVAAAIDAGLSLLSLFKTDVNMQGIAITGDDLALQAAIASDFRHSCPKAVVIDPAHFIPQIQATAPTTVLGSLGAVSDLRNLVSDRATKAQTDIKTAQKSLDDQKAKLDTNTKTAADLSGRAKDLTKKLAEAKTPAEKAEINKQLESVKADIVKNQDEKIKLQNGITDLGRQVDRLTVYAAKATAFVTGIDALNSALMKPDDSGMTLLNRMLRAESLAINVADTTRFLSVHFVAIGGNNITKKNFFSTSIAYSGGTVVDYLMTDNHGSILKSGIMPVYGKKVSENDLNKTLE